jgi:predicted ThiF/HesA family dinucleotide-utilizing enzyme
MMIVAYYLVLSHVPYVHDFDNITPLSSDHMADTYVSENNRVMMSKS